MSINVWVLLPVSLGQSSSEQCPVETTHLELKPTLLTQPSNPGRKQTSFVMSYTNQAFSVNKYFLFKGPVLVFSVYIYFYLKGLYGYFRWIYIFYLKGLYGYFRWIYIFLFKGTVRVFSVNIYIFYLTGLTGIFGKQIFFI